MGDGSGGSNSADSYIGSLISLTSKSEIRYEGVLYTVDTENSNIALQNVRSFGTEGRKKDGPQILPSDKVYDYIIFRGSDIKDLQVKSSPAVQSSLQAPSDPAIISLQSQYSQSAAIPPTYVSPQVGPPVDVGPSTAYSGISPSPFRGAVHSLYQPATGIGSWGLPPPGANGTGIAVPMYWQGYYRPASGQTHVHHQPVPQPPPSLPAPPHLLQLASRSYPHVELTSDAIQAQGNGAFMNTSMSPSGAPFPVSTTGTATSIPPQTSVMLSSATASVSTPATPADFLKSSSNTETTLSTGSTVSTSLNGVSAVITPAAKVPRRVTLSLQPTQVAPQSTAAATLAGASTLSMSKPSVSTVNIASSPGSETGFDKASGFLIASGKNFVARTQLPERKGTDLTTSGSQVVGVPTMDKQQQQALQPLLPLPTSSLQPKHPLQGNGSVGMSNYVRKGRARGGRGRGNMLPHATQHFTEDFDFTAMNKKFNKDEVWGELGGKGECRDKVSDIDEEGVNHLEETSEPTLENVVPDLLKKPVYVKDDFFDSLSCDALDREEGRAERTKFSEQRKIDTETFGNFPLRSRAGRGRGGGRRGGYRGAYYSSQYASGGGRAVVYGRHRGPP